MPLTNPLPRLAATATLLVLVGAGPGAAGVYKWTDADGEVHFSDKPPPGAEVETIKASGAGADSHTAERLNQMREQADEAYEKRTAARAAAEEEKEKEKEEAAHCEKVRGELWKLENSTRRQFINAQGEREFIDEEKRQEWMRVAREQIEKYCK